MSGFRFENPMAFYWLIVVPALWFVNLYFARRKAAKLRAAFGEKPAVFLTSSFDPTKARWRVFLEMFIVSMVICAWARPQTAGGVTKVRNDGIEVMLLVDVSRSMLAEDVKPSRLEVAKRELERFVSMGTGNKFGIVAFAGSAVLLSPVTTDTQAIKMYIDSLSTDTVSTQGTDFKRALQAAEDALLRGGEEESADAVVTKALIVASDGEDHEPGALELADELSKKDIRIFTVAFGTEKGAPVPVKDSQGETRGYLNDRQGQTVLSQVNGEELKKLAEAGKGAFHHFSFTSDAMKSIYGDLDKLQKSKFNDGEVRSYDEKFQIFLILALAGFIVYWLLGERRPRGRLWKGRFEVAAQ